MAPAAAEESGRMLSAEAIRRLPKVQLHCHLEGTVRAATFRELAERYGVDIGARARVPLARTYDFATFGEFLLLFAEVCKVLRTPDDLARVARDYAEDATAQGVVYAELFISPSVWTFFHRDLEGPAAVAAIRRALDDAASSSGLEVPLIADLTRNFGAERALASTQEASRLRDFGVIGIGLGGDEARYPARLFAEAYDVARRAGLRTVAHAGEAAGAESVRSAIEDLGAERIGHGIRALEDAGLVSELAQRRIPFEICPTSNRLTGAVAPGVQHPLADLDRSGVVCVIDADDPALFETTLCDEYAIAASIAGEDAPLRFARNAVDASFASTAKKASLHAALDAFGAESVALRRSP